MRLKFLGLLLVSIVAHAELSSEERTQIISKTDEGYRTLVPSAPATIPGRDYHATPEEQELNDKYTNHPKACKFYPSDVWDSTMTETSRIKHMEKRSWDYDANGRELLRQCNAIKSELGEESCASIILGGHANGISVGLGKFIGYRLTEGTWQRFPQNQQLFDDVVACLNSIAYKKAPIIFASCGAAHVPLDYPEEKMRGYLVFYAHKKEAQDLLANIFGRTVISALGPENEQDFGNHSRFGWYVSEPSFSRASDLHDFKKHLPTPKVQWKDGAPTHEIGNFDIEADRDLHP